MGLHLEIRKCRTVGSQPATLYPRVSDLLLCGVEYRLTLLSTDGCYLRQFEQRKVALDFLKEMQKNMGWNCQVVVSLLEEQWGVLDEHHTDYTVLEKVIHEC